MYERLDIDNDGTVDIRDLTAALKHEMPHIPTRLAPVCERSVLIWDTLVSILRKLIHDIERN